VYSFVFSSRRRHTRSTRDWSSDVCSSDLFQLGAARGLPGHGEGAIERGERLLRVGDDADRRPRDPGDLDRVEIDADHFDVAVERSEERRVGKGCRDGGWGGGWQE